MASHSFLAFSFFLILGSTVSASSEDDPKFLVSPDWVASHLDDPTIVLLQVGTIEQYDSTHIPGAYYIALSDITIKRGEEKIPFELPSTAHLDSVFESKGVSDNSRIVVYYGRDWISPTARVYLTLDYLGFGDRTLIMDGGMSAWMSQGYAVTSDPSLPRQGALTPHPRTDVVVTVEWMKDNYANPATAVIDSRNKEYYTGQDRGNSQRPGHIPGARSLPFSELIDEEYRFKDKEMLGELFRKDITEGKTVVSYCHIGQQASLTYFVARYLGYDARMYDGSMNEWSRNPDLPLVTGEE